jgi:hypothetical protein
MAGCCNLLSARNGNESSANVATDGNPRSSLRARRSLVATRWSLPALILILLPKCPACLAAYIALGTGVSLGAAASSNLRLALIGVCVAAIILNIVWLAIAVRGRNAFGAFIHRQAGTGRVLSKPQSASARLTVAHFGTRFTHL